MTDRSLDPVLASVLECRLKAITEEMGLTLLRTTRSPILNEARDFVTGLYGPAGEILAQSEYIPILAFALQPACRAVIDAFDGDVHPGDVFLHNDVFSGGNQNNDVAVFKPANATRGLDRPIVSYFLKSQPRTLTIDFLDAKGLHNHG